MRNEHWLVKYSRGIYEQSCAEHDSNVNFCDDPDVNYLLNDLENFPHAFVLGCCMDKQVKAERAWSIPYAIKGECETFSMDELASHDWEWYKEIFTRKKLHRYNETMSKVFYDAVMHIKEKYHSDASEIWANCPSSAEVVCRFLEFNGVGIKIATMAANILCNHFFIPFSDMCSIDVSPDVHVMRIFARCGLVPYNASREMVVYKARDLCPEFPGIVDGPCWQLGVEFCRPTNPNCTDCPVSGDCPKKMKAADVLSPTR